jgi:hypothetical protein
MAEQSPQIYEKYLPQLFDTYPNISFYDPDDFKKKKISSWFVWTKDGKIKTHFNKVCHADMHYYASTGWDELITAVPKSDDLSLEYLRMIIRGPFKSMSHLIKLDKVDNNYYLHCMSLDKWPANVLFNFCIASRVPIEFSGLLKPWAKRCEEGYDPVLAYLLTYSYGYPQKTTRSFHFGRPGHLWFDPGSDWQNILNGTFQNVSDSYKTSPSDCCPSNIIWGYNKDSVKFQSMSDEQIAEFYKKPIQVLEPLPPPEPPKKKKQLGLGYQINWDLNPALQQVNNFGQVNFEQQPPQPVVLEVDVEIDEDFEWIEDEFD